MMINKLSIKTTPFLFNVLIAAVLCLITISCDPGSTTPTPPGGVRITYVNSQGIGKIAVRLTLPEEARYPEGAPVVVNITTFFTNKTGFQDELPTTKIGAIYVSYLWPGKTEPEDGIQAQSDGEYDYGGPNCIAALKDVIRFSLGLTADVDGYYISDLSEIVPLTDNVGLYAFSHPGIAATNVLALYGDELTGIQYFVGRENPTLDCLSSVEIGHWDEQNRPVLNPYYQYPQDYSATALDIDYSSVGWQIDAHDYPEGRPYFALTGGDDYVLGSRVPTMWDKRFYSVAMTRALRENGALSEDNWPSDVATVDEAKSAWSYRETVNNYPLLRQKASDVKVMLVFAEDDHVHPVSDKPHIHQAYDGFSSGAKLWVRLNPDRQYVNWINDSWSKEEFPDNDANKEPDNWSMAEEWAYPNMAGSNELVPLAAVAEMVDRAREDEWSENLDNILVEVQPPSSLHP